MPNPERSALPLVPAHRGQLPDKVALARSCQPQSRAKFFSRLPSEIRQMIYIEMWRTAGSLRQHILTRPQSSGLTHVACTTDPTAEDVRYARFLSTSGREKQAWEARCKSEWCLHWACEPASAQDKLAWSPFLPVLLTSKRMYLEAHPTIFSSLTFVFTDTMVAAGFLSAPQWSPRAFQSIELCIRASNFIVELYYPEAGADGPFPAWTSHPNVTATNNPWERVCKALSSFQDLRVLRVWFDCKDLRPWHKRFAETRVFRSLWQVKAREFTLALPKLPQTTALDAAAFLDGERLEGAPFVVERGPRPNNWKVHLATMNEMLIARQLPT